MQLFHHLKYIVLSRFGISLQPDAMLFFQESHEPAKHSEDTKAGKSNKKANVSTSTV
jgi:hypothetical protein